MPELTKAWTRCPICGNTQRTIILGTEPLDTRREEDTVTYYREYCPKHAPGTGRKRPPTTQPLLPGFGG